MENNNVIKKLTVKDQTQGFTPYYYLGTDGEYVTVNYNNEKQNLQDVLSVLEGINSPALELNQFLKDGIPNATYNEFVQAVANAIIESGRLRVPSWKKSEIPAVQGKEFISFASIVGDSNKDLWKEILVLTSSPVNTNNEGNVNIYQSIITREMIELTNDTTTTSNTEFGSDRKNLTLIIAGGGGNYERNVINEHLCTWALKKTGLSIRQVVENGVSISKNVSTVFYWR